MTTPAQDYCVFDGNAKIPPQSLKQNYTATLLDRLIQDKINGKLDQFRETVQLVAFYSAASFGSWQQRQYCEVRLAEYLKQADSTPEMFSELVRRGRSLYRLQYSLSSIFSQCSVNQALMVASTVSQASQGTGFASPAAALTALRHSACR